MELYLKVCKQTNKLSWMLSWLNLEWSKELEEAVEASRLKVTAKEIVYCAWITATLIIALTLCISALLLILNKNPATALIAGLLLATLLAYYIQEYPKTKAKNLKIKSLGKAPEIVAYLIIPLKQNPNLEDAVKFAAENGEGEMAEDLKKILKGVWCSEYRSVGEALPVLGYRWGKEMKGFDEAMHAIRTSQIEKSESRRLDALDRALETIIDSVQRSFEEYINYLRLPTMIIFAGGTLLPLIVVILIPLISLMGLEFGRPENIFVILSALVLVIFLYSEYTLTKRPAAFPPTKVPYNYPGLPHPGKIRLLCREYSAFAISLILAAVISALSLPYFLGCSFYLTDKLSTLPIVFGVGAGIWLYLVGTTKPRKELRDKLKRLENEIIEASFQLGNRLIAGMSAEDAFIRVAEMMKDKENKSMVSPLFEKAVKNIRYLNMGLEDSLFDETRGALSSVPSGVVRSIFRIFIKTMKKSTAAASEALILAANHIKQVRRLEDSLREKISYTTAMMKATAMLINPMICGLSVYISETFKETINKTKTLNGSEFNTAIIINDLETSPEMLQLITGLYAVMLLLVLVRYASTLEYGEDSIAYRLEAAKGIPIALFAFSGVILLMRFI